MSKFLLDANIFIEAYQRYYSFDIAPAFWNALQQGAEAGKLISIDRVFQEINSYDDEDRLKLWANNEFSKWFASTDDEAVFNAYREIINWAVNQPQFFDSAKTEFASVADSWLIAFAKAHNYTVVTHEIYSADVRRRILIPNVCRAFDIPYINTFEMLRKLNIRLG
ncbi:MAG TPA: DUF4411 family protein [Desulfosporosinus sp.]|nr:DUF4411 family protein [Desulfosporosinus sp.]